MNDVCDMCHGSGEGSGGWRGICGYCDGTGEGACSECRYPSSDRNPPSGCGSHGPSPEGLARGRALRGLRLRDLCRNMSRADFDWAIRRLLRYDHVRIVPGRGFMLTAFGLTYAERPRPVR